MKHIDHYVGPAKVTKHTGTRSVQLEMEEVNGRNIKKPKAGDVDPTIPQRAVIGTQIHTRTNTPPCKLASMLSSRMGL